MKLDEDKILARVEEIHAQRLQGMMVGATIHLLTGAKEGIQRSGGWTLYWKEKNGEVAPILVCKENETMEDFLIKEKGV